MGAPPGLLVHLCWACLGFCTTRRQGVRHTTQDKSSAELTLSFLRSEGQTSSSLEDDGIGHGHLHNCPLRKGGRWFMVKFPSLLGVEGQTANHCKVRHEDQAIAPASDEDIFVGSFTCAPFRNRADLPMGNLSF